MMKNRIWYAVSKVMGWSQFSNSSPGYDVSSGEDGVAVPCLPRLYRLEDMFSFAEGGAPAISRFDLSRSDDIVRNGDVSYTALYSDLKPNGELRWEPHATRQSASRYQ